MMKYTVQYSSRVDRKLFRVSESPRQTSYPDLLGFRKTAHECFEGPVRGPRPLMLCIVYGQVTLFLSERLQE